MRQHDVRDGYAALRTQLFQRLRVRFPGVVVRPVCVQEQVFRTEIVSAGLRRIRLRPPHAAHVPPARIHLKLRISPDQSLAHRKLVVQKRFESAHICVRIGGRPFPDRHLRQFAVLALRPVGWFARGIGDSDCQGHQEERDDRDPSISFHDPTSIRTLYR